MYKYKISKEDYENLSDIEKKLYSEKNGSFLLTVEGVESEDDVKALKNAKEYEKTERKKLEAQLKELQQKLDGNTEEEIKKKGDIQALEESYKKKLKETSDALEAEKQKHLSHLSTQLLNSTVSELSLKIAPNAKTLISPHIKNRLSVEFENDTPIVRVLDKDGKISANTLDDLHKEFVNNPEFKPIVGGTNASGSGVSTSQNQAVLDPTKKQTLATMSPKDLAARMQNNKMR
jgi:hypothetical protein